MTEPDARLLAYLDAMLERNRAVNLTAVRDRAQAEVLHVRDSLAAEPLLAEPVRALDQSALRRHPPLPISAAP